jgi:hypothetical protein
MSEENKTTDYEKLVSFMAWGTNRLAEIADYNWSGEFCKEEAERAMKSIREELAKLDFSTMNLEELKNVRFGSWTETTLLCPLYAQPVLKPNVDNDVRFGCVADGWEIKEGKVLFDKSKDINSDES